MLLPRTLVLLLGALCSMVVPASGAVAAERDTDPFSGLGAWVDVFDFVPAFRQVPGPIPFSGETVDDLAALGVETIYLQAAIDDPRERGLIVDRARVGSILRRAHDNDMRVVAWYYPQLTDPARDRERLDAIAEFESDGETFDAIALDIESRLVPDVTIRNQRLVRMSRYLREQAGDRSVGAIVYPAVQMEVINPLLWPDFPYGRLQPHFDVWMPMAYWTYREAPYRDAFTYTEESVRRLRENLDDPDVEVHPIGGLGELAQPVDYQSFMRAVREVEALGWSIYDAHTTATTAWRFLSDE